MGWRSRQHYDPTAHYTLRITPRTWLALCLGLAIGIAASTVLAAVVTRAFAAEPLTGTARVIDADTIQVGDVRIRLHGIDAPEAEQTCMTPRGGSWKCGADAIGLLFDLVDGKPVTCKSQPAPDKYGRTLATCTTATHDINAVMVCRGMAWAFREYSVDYVAHEEDAKTRKVGIWQADTVPAWQYRKDAWDKALEQAPLGKPIVGVKRSRIYHTPWSPHYRKLNLADIRGKEFFADEAQAMAAGYEPPKVRPSFIRRARKLLQRDPTTHAGSCG